MKVHSQTDVGLVRTLNEDACRTGLLGENGAWAVVCDGMGGANGGEIASETAVKSIEEQILASYEEDFYAGTPVITENSFGAGKAYYVGTRSSQEFYRMFMRERMEEKGISPVLEAPEGVEATERFKDGKGVMFVLNHNDEETAFVLNEARKDLLTGEQYEGGTVVTLEAKGVMLLEN